MSVNLNPEWCKILFDESLSSIQCPNCQKDYPETFKKMFQEYITGSYYELPHIPKTILITCDNIDCENCDGDFEIELEVWVKKFSLTKTTKLVQ